MRKMLFAVCAFTAVSGMAAAPQVRDVPSRPADWEQINRAAFAKSLVPVALPKRDHIPFWNAHAVQFICPPAFDFARIEGAANYRFELLDDHDNLLAAFTADDPQESLAAVWAKVPVGFVNLHVFPLNAAGCPGNALFKRRFYRCAWFHGPYKFTDHDYLGGARRCFAYVYNLPHVQAWLRGGTVDDKVYRKYCYPSKMLPAMIRALRHHAELDGNPETLKTATGIIAKMADWLIANSCAPGTPLEYLPPTYWKDTTYSVAKQYVGQIMMIYPMYAGNAYLDAFELTGDAKYLQAACRLADSMARLQLPNGSWYLKLYERDGKPVVPNVVVFDGAMHRFLTRLAAHSSQKRYLEMRDRAMTRMWTHNLRYWDWDGQFEDTQPKPQYENLTKDDALFAAEELFKKGDVATALRLTDWCEDQFVVWSDPAPSHLYVKTWRLPAALEQYHCYMPIDASTGQFVFAFCRAYRMTGNRVYLEKAKALADNILHNQLPDGSIPTFFQESPYLTWLNCMIFASESLLYLDETLKLPAVPVPTL